MKFLCICQYGHSRSVACTRILHLHGKDAVAIGWSTAGAEAIRLLSAWADKILLCDGQAKHYIQLIHTDKVLNFDPGPDKWSNPYNQELLDIFEQKLIGARLI